MQWWTDIRRKVLIEQVSKRKIMAEYGIHVRTLDRILSHPEPPGYRISKPRPKPVLGPFLGRIEEILRQDREVPRKQRHTAKRIFDRRLQLVPCAMGEAFRFAFRKIRYMMAVAMKEDPKAEKDHPRIIQLDVDCGDPRRPIHGKAKSKMKHETKLIDTRTGKEIPLSE